MSMKGRNFLTLKDFSSEEINQIIDLGIDLKNKQKSNIKHHLLEGKTLGMIFQKASTRTRVSFEVGMYQLGGQALFLNTNDLQIGRGEPIKDTARVLSRYLDAILIRTYSHEEVEALAAYSTVPVINGLTDSFHPTQVIADLITIKEHKKTLKGLNFAYVGDGNNMVQSLMIGLLKCGLNVSVATPKQYAPDDLVVEYATQLAKENQCQLTLSNNPLEVVQQADIVYTDTWASMGQENEKLEREKAFQGFQVDEALFSQAKDDAIFMHCLPAYRGYEVTDEIMEHKNSVVFDEAENRLHAHKAILASVL